MDDNARLDYAWRNFTFWAARYIDKCSHPLFDEKAWRHLFAKAYRGDAGSFNKCINRWGR